MICSEPEVMLIFPPLVESSFGSFYPSTAVLSAWLQKHGFQVAQRNLNSEFVAFLLSDKCLARLGAGDVPGVSAKSLIGSCARWARRERGRLVDGEGHYILGRSTQFGYVVEELAQPFVIDPGSEALKVMTKEARSVHPLDTHTRFLEFAHCETAVPASVRLLGISVAMGPQLVPGLLLAQTLKISRPDLKIVLGGPVMSLMAMPTLDELLRNHRAVDAVVRFDGEIPLLGLARQVRAGEWEPQVVPGVSALDQGVARHAPPIAGPDLNSLPIPDYPPEDIARLNAPKLSVTQARGCYWGKCDYCDFVELYDGSPPYRGRRAEIVLAEIEDLISRYGIRQFTFITESIPPAFARRLSMLIIDRGIDISWDSFAMVDRRFDRDLLALMVRAGCGHLVIGMETMTTRVLKLVSKSADREENLRFLREAHAAGMKLTVNLIPDLPTTGYSEALASLADLTEMANCLDSVSVFPFEPTRSSNIGRAPGRFGLIPIADISEESQAQYTLNHMASLDPAMTTVERTDVYKRFRAFARRIHLANKAANGEDPALPLATDIDSNTRVRLALEDVDLFDSEDKIVCTHIVSRELIEIPAAAAEILRPYFGGDEFSGQIFSQRVGDGAAEALLASLMEARMVVRVNPSPGW
jgi:hypothetical protein